MRKARVLRSTTDLPATSLYDTLVEQDDAARAVELRNFLPAKFVAELNAYLDSLPPGGDGKVISHDGKNVVDRRYRQCKARYVTVTRRSPNVLRRLNAEVKAVVRDHNRDFFKYDIHAAPTNEDGVPSYMIVDYDKTDKFHWHMDWGGTHQSCLRKLSVSIQLSHPEAYEGGNFEIFTGKGRYTAPRDTGAMVMFKSDAWHRVTPIKRGSRRSIVAWFRGDQPYR